MIVARYEVPGTCSKKRPVPEGGLIARIGPTDARGFFVLHEGAIDRSKPSLFIIAVAGESPLHFCPIDIRSFTRSIKPTTAKTVQFVLLLCGIIGIASKLLVSCETKDSPTATVSNSEEPPASRPHGNMP
jgi:hypothetical protein